jgi:FMN-dependent NADH-azoreductase
MSGTVIANVDPQVEKLLSRFQANLRETPSREILGIGSSPRTKGNSTLVLEKVLEGCRAAGASTEIHRLNEMRTRGCQACEWCQTYGTCALKDDLTSLTEKIRSARGIVLASPIYMEMISSGMKELLDRFYRFYDVRTGGSRLETPVPCVLVLSQANPDGGAYRDHADRLSALLGGLGFPVRDVVWAVGVAHPGDVLMEDRVMEAALGAGRKLAAG